MCPKLRHKTDLNNLERWCDMNKELKSVPFVFKNESTESEHKMTLSGTVGQDSWWSDEKRINSKNIREALDDVTVPITIYLNSPGGYVFEGIEIYNYLKNHEQEVTIEVTGLAASAASVIAMGADKVVMNTGTSLMVHEASTFTWGNKGDIQKTLNALETIDNSLVGIYVEKTEKSTDDINSWLTSEKWFTADEAVENGLADEVKKKVNEDEIDVGALVKNSVAEAMKKFSASSENVESETGPKNKLLMNLQKLGGIN